MKEQEKIFREMIGLLEAVNYEYIENHFISATLQIAIIETVERAKKNLSKLTSNQNEVN